MSKMQGSWPVLKGAFQAQEVLDIEDINDLNKRLRTYHGLVLEQLNSVATSFFNKMSGFVG